MSNFNPHKHHRRSIRLDGYDYSKSGAYFITIVTKNRTLLFGDIIDGKMIFNDYGEIANKCWLDIPNHYPNVQLDKFIVMPNHLHGILIINETIVGANNYSPLQQSQNEQQMNKFRSPSKTIGSIIRGFKIGVTKWFHNNTNVFNVWQRNYYEHIIRDDNELNRIQNYIINNPSNWKNDVAYKQNYIS